MFLRLHYMIWLKKTISYLELITVYPGVGVTKCKQTTCFNQDDKLKTTMNISNRLVDLSIAVLSHLAVYPLHPNGTFSGQLVHSDT